MRKGGIVTERRRQRQRGKRLRRCAGAAGLVLLLCALALSSPLREGFAALMDSGMAAASVFASAKTGMTELTLEEIEVYALQLGVFDSGERAQAEQKRLLAQGVPCAIWQRDKMRLICSVAHSRETLDSGAAGGNEAYIVRDTLPRVRLRLSCSERACDDAAAFIALPDALLSELLSGKGRALRVILPETLFRARKALDAHPENALYTGLAQSLIAWCEAVQASLDQPQAECYAAVTLCTLCREWRSALLNDYSPSAESAASAQRTPSTAADVMPPA